MQADRVLVLENDHTLRDSIEFHLTIDGFACAMADSSHSAFETARLNRFDLLIIGFSVSEAPSICERLRVNPLHRHTPMLVMTPPSREADAITLLERHADDYVITPVSVRELTARARGLIRRSRLSQDPSRAGAPPSVGTIVKSGITIEPARRLVTAGCQRLSLTERELQLLCLLASQAGVVFDRKALLADIWGERATVTMRSVDVLVRRLRDRMRLLGKDQHLVTVRGVGYSFVAD